MATDGSYYAARFPEPVRLLNVDLRPFSLGHLMLLEWLGNAFVTGAAPAVDDLITGVWVCSLSYREAEQSLRTGQVEFVTRRRWGKPKRRMMPLPDVMREWQRIVGPFSLPEKAREFAEYIAQSCRSPIVCTTHGEPQEDVNPCPSSHVVLLTLMTKLHLPESDLMDRPWSLCIWDFYALRCIEGHAKFMDPEALSNAQSVAEALQARADRGEFKAHA